MFSVLSTVTSLARLPASTSGDWLNAAAAIPIMSAAEKIRDTRLIRMAVQVLHCCCPAGEVSRELVSNIGCSCGGHFLLNSSLVYGVRSFSRVEGNGDARCFSCVRVNPVVKPAGEHNK